MDIVRRVEKLFKSNITIIMSKLRVKPCQNIQAKNYNLCKSSYTIQNSKTADHNHFSGKFRKTIYPMHVI